MSRNHPEAAADAGSVGGAEGAAAAKASAPHPDDPRKPDDPTDLTKRSWGYVAKKTFREFQKDQCTDLAAALTYFAVFAIAPAALALVSLLGVFGNGQAIVEQVMTLASDMGAPEDAVAAIQPIIEGLAGQQGAGLGLLVGLLTALWSASGYVNAFSRAMNRMYEVDEGRGFVKLRLTMLLVTLALLIIVAVILVAMVLSGGFAESVGSAIGLSSVTVTVWNIAKWPVILLLVVLLLAILYYFTPNVQQPKIKWISIGSLVALVVWALATLAFGFYIANFGGASYNETYGALAGVILFLLWVWITNNAMLFGAELDAELERGRELQAGIEAEETLQLPPRDTKASAKRAKQHEKDVADARALRLSAGEHTAEDGDRTGSEEPAGRRSGSRR